MYTIKSHDYSVPVTLFPEWHLFWHTTIRNQMSNNRAEKDITKNELHAPTKNWNQKFDAWVTCNYIANIKLCNFIKTIRYSYYFAVVCAFQIISFWYVLNAIFFFYVLYVVLTWFFSSFHSIFWVRIRHSQNENEDAYTFLFQQQNVTQLFLIITNNRQRDKTRETLKWHVKCFAPYW